MSGHDLLGATLFRGVHFVRYGEDDAVDPLQHLFRGETGFEMSTLAMAVHKKFDLAPEKAIHIIETDLTAMSAKTETDILTDEGDLIPFKNFWSDNKHGFANAYNAFQSWYSNCYSNPKSSFRKHYHLLWDAAVAKDSPDEDEVFVQNMDKHKWETYKAQMKQLLEWGYCLEGISTGLAKTPNHVAEWFQSVFDEGRGGRVLNPLVSVTKSFEHAWKYAAGIDKSYPGEDSAANRPKFELTGAFEKQWGGAAPVVTIGEVKIFVDRDISNAIDVFAANNDGLLKIHPHIVKEQEVAFKGGLRECNRKEAIVIPHLRAYQKELHWTQCGLEEDDFNSKRESWIKDPTTYFKIVLENQKSIIHKRFLAIVEAAAAKKEAEAAAAAAAAR